MGRLARGIQQTKVLEMKYKVLRTEKEHQSALQEAEALVALDPTPGSNEAERLELLLSLIHI